MSDQINESFSFCNVAQAVEPVFFRKYIKV